MEEFIGQNGTFTMPVEETNYISVLAKGYIISPDGRFITITGDHSDTFTVLLNKYLGDDKRRESTDGAIELCRLGFIVYFGIRLGDKAIDANYYHGSGALILPTNMTEEQERSVLTLLKTNYSIFRPSEKKMHLGIIRVEDFVNRAEAQINEDDLKNELKEKYNKYNL